MRQGSVRVRLTLLFGGLFLAAGAALLGITYGLVSHATSGIFASRISTGFGTAGGAAAAGGSAESGSAESGSAESGSAEGGPVLENPAGLSGLPDPAAVLAQAIQTAHGAQAAENDDLLLYSGIALAIMAVASVALGWLVAGRALRPLRRITAAAQRISATNLNERLALDGPDDDLRELADTIDGLFARLDASLCAQRQFTANASHELRTPLARSRTILEVALRDPAASAGSLRAACERALAAGAEQERLIEALLTLARGQRGLSRREPVDLAEVTRDVLAARAGQVASCGVSARVTLDPALLAGDPALVERAVANLADNALRYNVAGGTVWVTVGSDGGRATLSVSNTGAEVRHDETERLLLPFQRGGTAALSSRTRSRTRSRATAGSGSDAGLGLGLSIVAAIAATHDADFRITPRLDGGGLTARLVFPAVPFRSESPAAASDSRSARTARMALTPGRSG